MLRRKVILFLLVFALLLTSPFVNAAYSQGGSPVLLGHFPAVAQAEPPYNAYLPIILISVPPPAGPADVIMLGIYPTGWPGTDGMAEAHAIDTWAGKGLSIVGTFIGIEDPSIDIDVRQQLTTIWNNGYTPFVNLLTQYTATDIVNGKLDTKLYQWKTALRQYANGGERLVFLAPLDEMNGDWVSYGSADPSKFKNAYWHIQSIFSNSKNGAPVPDESLRWVFAPNGWSSDGYPDFERYYPGAATTDVVAFSSYNYGCAIASNGIWKGEFRVFRQYLERMTAMAPDKPIIVAQTGTTAKYYSPTHPCSFDDSKKNDWLFESYAYLAVPPYPNLRAIIYFNKGTKSIPDLPFWTTAKQYGGFQQGIAFAPYIYVPPTLVRNYFP